ncbi:MAG: hypothetical protein EBU31_15305, partial [Proteobacteria bacterium]|nr:hypothetical protein [Pseudomonadota bacterium]
MSWAQTCVQQGSLFEAWLGCGVQGSPASRSPHFILTHLVASSGRAVYPTHTTSQVLVQQKASISHTAAQQLPSLHPGRSCSTKQSPASDSPQALPQRSSADAAQRVSQVALQHSGSARQ